MPVPFADPQLQYQTIKGEIDGATSAVIRDNAFIPAALTLMLSRREFAGAAEVKHCVSCANGTDALYLAMAALKVPPGDEVITTAHSWISTSAIGYPRRGHRGILRYRRPHVHDRPQGDRGRDHTATHRRHHSRASVRTACGYGRNHGDARKHKLWVIEDCAQAHLARYKGRQIGTFGVAATYSFYPGKNLGAMGDAGAVVTNDDALAAHMTMLARHGGVVKHQHHIEASTAASTAYRRRLRRK